MPHFKRFHLLNAGAFVFTIATFLVLAWASPALAVPDISVSGNGNEIVNGDATPSIADHTNFRNVNVSSGAMVRTFTIANTGIENLNLTGGPLVAIGGAAAGDFTVTTQPTTPVVPSATTTFDVTFDPSAAGVRSASNSIGSDDSDENPYTFAIQGYGSTPGGGTPDPEPEPEPDPAPKPGSPKGTSPSPTTSMNGPSLSWPSVSGARVIQGLPRGLPRLSQRGDRPGVGRQLCGPERSCRARCFITLCAAKARRGFRIIPTGWRLGVMSRIRAGPETSTATASRICCGGSLIPIS
jgi:hypothetical protein